MNASSTATATATVASIKQHASLSAGISILGVIWMVCGLLLFVGSKFFYRRDYNKIQQQLQQE